MPLPFDNSAPEDKSEAQLDWDSCHRRSIREVTTALRMLSRAKRIVASAPVDKLDENDPRVTWHYALSGGIQELINHAATNASCDAAFTQELLDIATKYSNE